MKSKTQHVHGSSSYQQFEAFHTCRLEENEVCFARIVGSTKTHKSESISQSKGKHPWNQQTQHVDDY